MTTLGTGKRGCHGKTKKGALCDASALKTGTVIDGVTVKGKHCRAHDPDLPASSRFGSHAQAREAAKLGGRPPMPKPTEVMRQLVEANAEHILGPYFRTLGLCIVRSDDGTMHAEVDPDGGAKLFGESKDGEIRMTSIDDLGAMIAAADKVLDRIFGKPKQATELTGAEGGAVEIVPVSREKAGAVASMRKAIGLGGG